MMTWNIIYQNCNSNKIEIFNIFSHSRFLKDVEAIKCRNEPFKETSKNLRDAAMYYFWSKCEWEIVVTSWPPYITREESKRLTNEFNNDKRCKCNVRLDVSKKIDVMDQLQMNWDTFVHYVMNYKENDNEFTIETK